MELKLTNFSKTIGNFSNYKNNNTYIEFSTRAYEIPCLDLIKNNVGQFSRKLKTNEQTNKQTNKKRIYEHIIDLKKKKYE